MDQSAKDSSKSLSSRKDQVGSNVGGSGTGDKSTTPHQHGAMKKTIDATGVKECTENGSMKNSMPNQQGHIMLSYNWDNQPQVICIKEKLEKSGYKLWIDFEQIRGDLHKCMAEGVEGSAVVVIFMTEKYSNSPSCKKELEYAEKKGKKIVPVKLDKNFEPDGALGILVAGKIFVDFSDESQFNSSIQSLKKEIDATNDAPTTKDDAADTSKIKQNSKKVLQESKSIDDETYRHQIKRSSRVRSRSVGMRKSKSFEEAYDENGHASGGKSNKDIRKNSNQAVNAEKLQPLTKKYKNVDAGNGKSGEDNHNEIDRSTQKSRQIQDICRLIQGFFNIFLCIFPILIIILIFIVLSIDFFVDQFLPLLLSNINNEHHHIIDEL